MRKNISQNINRQSGERVYLENDWYGAGIPGNVHLGENFYISSSQGFEQIKQTERVSLKIGNEVGLYDQFSFEIGTLGKVSIGDYSIINSARFRCVQEIIVGKYCMISWGVFITDSWIKTHKGAATTQESVINTPEATIPMEYSAPVILEDNVWIGFGCVLMPGVRIGEGAIVSSKTVVDKNVEPYSIVGGNPMRVLKRIEKC